MANVDTDLEWANRSMRRLRDAKDMVVTRAEPGHTCLNCDVGTPAEFLVDEGEDWDDRSVYPNGHHPKHKRFWYWCGCDGGG